MKQYDDVDLINSRLDIVDVAYTCPLVKGFHRVNGDRYAGYTGAHSDSKASFVVTSSEQKWSDKANGNIGGMAFNLIALEVTGTRNPRGHDFTEALKVAAERAGITLSSYSEEDTALFEERENLIDLYEKANEVFVNNLQRNDEMLKFIQKQWGITSEQAKEYGIGYAIGNEELKQFDKELLIKSGLVFKWDNGKTDALFKHRITFPYYKNGRPVYFIGRITRYSPEFNAEKPSENKYKKLLTYKEDRPYISKTVRNDIIFGQDHTIGKKVVYITEGVGDTVAAQIAGLPAISPITTYFPHAVEPRLIELLRGKDKVYIINDNDAPDLEKGETSGAGEIGAIKTARLLERAGIPAFIVMLPKPDETKKMDLAEFLINNTVDDLHAVFNSDSTLRTWEHLLSKIGDYSEAKSLDKIRDFRKFISEELKGMDKDEFGIFVNDDVRKKFCLQKKEVESTIKEVSKNIGNDISSEVESESEEEDSGEDNSGASKIPPLEERLKNYPENVIKKANEILDSGDPFKYIMKVWNKHHVGDTELGEMLLCSVGTTQVRNAGIGLHNKPSGDAQSGKSHGCMAMGELLPTWKFLNTTFTAKNLYYNKRLVPGVIVYTDDIDLSDRNSEVIQTLKKATADFESTTNLDTVIDGEGATLSIPERATFWLSSVTTIEDVQLGTRFVYSSTEDGDYHNREVSHKQNGRCAGKPLAGDNEDVLVCRCILEYICDEVHYVFSPYGFVSDWIEKSEKRNHEKFLDVLMSVTVFKYRQREKVNDCLIGTLEDWKRAVSIYSPIAQNNSCLLSDEEITILYSIHEMQEAFPEGVPHKRLLKYMKEEGKYKKSDSTLKRTLIGKAGAENTGFKEKVPGFSFEKVSMPKLDEDGFPERGAGNTLVMCYTYDGDLFDGINPSDNVVDAIKSGVFATCDYSVAEAFEQLFREDPVKAHSLRENTKVYENWKQSLRNHKDPSEIIRNPQNSNPMNSEKTSQSITNNNKIIDNNNLRNHKMEDKGGDDNSPCVSSSRDETKTHTKLNSGFSPENVNSVNSEPLACDHAHEFREPVLISEAPACDIVVISEETATEDNDIYLIPLLRSALVKHAKEEYHLTVPNLDEFIRSFCNKIPEYQKSLGKFAVENEARKLKMKGWRF